jgi:hypothetical protein
VPLKGKKRKEKQRNNQRREYLSRNMSCPGMVYFGVKTDISEFQNE